MLRLLLTILIFAGPIASYSAEPLTLDQALGQAMRANPRVAQARAQAQAERSMVTSESWLESPRIGFMREKNMWMLPEGMSGDDMTMDSWSVSQEIMFPAKYFVMGSAQKSVAKGMEREAEQAMLDVRAQTVGGYYRVFAVKRVLALLEAQREALREIARIAEARYATGAAPQQDEMKAHVEQTMIEGDILMAQQEQASAEAALAAVLNQPQTADFSVPRSELPIPQLTMSPDKIVALSQSSSKMVQQAAAQADAAQSRKSLSYLNLAPDFMLSYRKPFGADAPRNAYEFEIGLTIPLWFFAKELPEISAARAQAVAAERGLEKSRLDQAAEARSLIAKVRSNEQILKLYSTGLIPQATSTLNSSRAAYRAGRTGFIDLLDSERSLYNLRITYYRTLAEYAEQVAMLEQVVGASVSTLPFQKMETLK